MELEHGVGVSFRIARDRMGIKDVHGDVLLLISPVLPTAVEDGVGQEMV